jgi:hypothetical protein
MTAFDYTDSTAPIDMELIPEGLIATVQTRIRDGGGGEDGVLKRSKNGDSEFLDCEFILVDTKHAKMKFWQTLLLAGETDGQKQMIDKSRAILKAMLDSAYGIQPDDKSPEARAKRKKELREFDGIRFLVKIAIEKGKPKSAGSIETYKDRNVIGAIITPDKPEYRGPIEQSGSPSGGSSPPSAASAPIVKPAWAQ